MNKKGSVSFNITGKVILGVLIFLVLIIAFIFPKVRIFLVGLALLGVALLIAVNGKLNRTRSIFVVMFLALGLVIIFFGNALLSNTELTGSSTLGLSQVQYFTSSDTCFNSGSPSNLWVYTIRGGGLGQSATGSYTPTEVGDLYSGNTEPTKTFTVTETYNQFCDYPIVTDTQATQIYSLNPPYSWTSVAVITNPVQKCIDDSKTKSKCLGGSGSYIIAGKYSGVFKCFCVVFNNQSGAIGSPQNFITPTVRTDMTIKVGSGTDTSSRTFSSNNDIVGQIGSNVCAVWQGNLVSGQNCGLPSSDTIPVYYRGNWVLLSKQKYDTYKTDYDTLLTTLRSGGVTEAGITTTINNYNSVVTQTLASQVNFGTINSPTTIIGAKVVKELNTLIQYPVTTLYIKANWLGVVTPVPIPSITTNPTSSCFASGTAGQITLNVKDIGDDGIMRVYGTCNNGFSITPDEQSYTSGEEKEITLDLTGSSNSSSTNGSCSIVVKALDKSVSKSVNVCVTGYPTCTETEPFCFTSNTENSIHYCKDLFNEDIKENCGLKNEVCKTNADGVASCVSQEPSSKCGNGVCDNGETFATCPQDCVENTLNCQDLTPKFLGYQEVTTTSQTIWSRLGLAKPKTTNWCKPTNEPYIVGGALALIIGLSALFIFKPKKKIKGKSTKYGKIGK